MRIRNAREVCVGVLFVLFGAFVLLVASTYPMGTATQMGPGYFPRLLAILMGVLGLIAIVQGLRAAEVTPIGPWPLVPLAFVVAGVLGFAALIDDYGLLPAVVGVVLMGCYERLLRRPVEVVAICLVLLALTWGVFIYGVQLPIDFW